MNDPIEQEILNKGLTAPRITTENINSNILHWYYFTAADGVLGAYKSNNDVHQGSSSGHESLGILTFCVLVLKNGFTVTGEAACASLEDFDAEVGRTIAFHKAIAKIWPLMGYELKQRLHEQKD